MAEHDLKENGGHSRDALARKLKAVRRGYRDLQRAHMRLIDERESAIEEAAIRLDEVRQLQSRIERKNNYIAKMEDSRGGWITLALGLFFGFLLGLGAAHA